MDANLICKDNLTYQFIKELIDSAYFDCKIEEDCILVDDKIQLSIVIEENKRSITFGAFYLYEDIPLDEKIKLANDFSFKYQCLTCTIQNETICISHEMWCQDGVTKKNFITFLRVFADSVNDAVLDIFGYSEGVGEI